MNKALLAAFVVASFLLALPAFAGGYIKENTVTCMSLKNIKTYTEAVKNNNEAFSQNLFASADCFSKIKQVKAMHISESGGFVSVKTGKGFVVWLKNNAFVPTEPLKK